MLRETRHGFTPALLRGGAGLIAASRAPASGPRTPVCLCDIPHVQRDVTNARRRNFSLAGASRSSQLSALGSDFSRQSPWSISTTF